MIAAWKQQQCRTHGRLRKFSIIFSQENLQPLRHSLVWWACSTVPERLRKDGSKAPTVMSSATIDTKKKYQICNRAGVAWTLFWTWPCILSTRRNMGKYGEVRGNMAFAPFLDARRAFVTVIHVLAFSSLNCLAIHGPIFCWITNFPHYRCMFWQLPEAKRSSCISARRL